MSEFHKNCQPNMDWWSVVASILWYELSVFVQVACCQRLKWIMEFCPSNAGKVPTLGFEIKNIFTTLVHQNGSDDHDTLLNFLAVNTTGWAKKLHHAIKTHDNTVRRLYCRLTVESVSFARWLVVRPPPMSHLLSQILPRDALQKSGSTYLTSPLGQKRKVLSEQTLNINWLTGE